MDSKRRQIIFIFLASCHLAQQIVSAEHRVKREVGPAPEQPRIVTTDGHLVFQTGANHNITFKSSTGGSVNIDGTNVKQMAEKVALHQTKLQDLNGIQTRVGEYKAQMDTLQTNVNTQFGDVNRRLTNTSTQISRMTASINNNRKVNRLTRKVNQMRTTLGTISTKLTFDNCGAEPCFHGGTCIDMYDRYRCLCPITWQGRTCNEDVNECHIYAGTAQGCQAGSTCLNTNGGFSCQCKTGFTGVLCNIQSGTCSEGSNSEICGHGTCVNSAATHVCKCDEGWKTDTSTPGRCIVDIDECAKLAKPCHDSVRCTNVPGRYYCGACPSGYTGNGHQCNDVNECLVNNGGCSRNPPVQCINTLGSRMCGNCPPGYLKTATEACVWVGVCNTNNGGCSPHATCHENPSLPTRSCRCNPGYQGNGEGTNGCVAIGGVTPSPVPCVPNPCQHGNCFTAGSSNSFTCSCFTGWTGYTCQDDVNECANNVCQNGGTCTNAPGNYTCTCTAFTTGRNCETPTYECGGELRGETGTFQFPPAVHDGYPHDVSCAWRITTVLHKILSIHFTRFALETHVNCEYDFLQIHDGSTASAHQIGKYCGNGTTRGLVGKTINTTHNQIYMWFKADRSINDQGFGFTWQSLTPVCGDDIRNATHGSIQSPGYPGGYPVNRTCVWTIRVPPGNNIQLNFVLLDLETHQNCSYDYLELRNGLRETDPVLRRYCSSTTPGVFTTQGNELYIKFHSDASIPGRGFLFTWAADPTARSCGGRLNLTDGILISPNYPNHYEHTADCVWVITVPENGKIALNFTAFSMETSNACAYDYLQIHDGTDDTGPMFGKFCGTELPGLITTTTNNMYLRFHSDASVSGNGFRATWTVACGGTFTSQTGTMVSPYWPTNYPHQKNCNYLLRARTDQQIEVTFTHFGVEASTGNTNCAYDHLLAYDGSTADSSVLRRMCGSAIPAPLISTANNMLLVFVTDGSIHDAGFRATYEFRNSSTNPVDPAVCGGILTNASGTIVSPGHPNFYPHSVNCLWEIRVTPGFQIRLTFNFFSIESTSSCSYDYVQITNNITNNGTRKYCGSTSPPVFTSTDNVLYIRLKSDVSIAHEGFSASYVSFNHSWCGNERRTLPGVITSPNYPENYPHQRECVWTISAPDNHQIALNITDFAMENHINCRYDYVEIRNGGNALSPLIGRFCGTTITSPMYSHSNRLWIKFKSDVSDSARGFRIWYEDAGEGCGAELTGPSGMFLSPNYPTSYNRLAECYWTITVAQGSSITLVLIDIDIESHSRCQYDYVEAIDGLHTGRSLARICGNTIPQPIHSRGNVMTVKFRSDTSLGGRGFHAAYYANCRNQVLNASSGVVESPNFPNSYPHNRNCSWIINAPLGSIISVSFSHFAIEADVLGSACRNDFLEIRDGNRPTSSVLTRKCGAQLPPRVNSTGNALYITFRSDASLAHNGFRLEYSTIGCGGDLRTLTGTFTSPNYPTPYPHNRECVWRITVPVGQRIQLQLNNVDIEFHSNCTYDFLEVLGGPDANSPTLTKICQNQDTSHLVTSSGNQMYVRFKTDASSSGKGFTANYTAIAGGCGGLFTTPSGSFRSPGHPNNYPHNSNCEWNITVADFQTVQLTLKEFDIESNDNCIYDYIALYDGLEANSPQIAKLCGHNLTDHVFTSSGKSMRVRLRTDESTAARGFAASYITGCGGRTVVGDGISIIRSPNFPLNYYPSTNCTWTLMGALAVDRITLTFTNMDIEESADILGICAHDSVRVLQGDNVDAPQQGIYCGTGVPASITSSGYALTIIFTADSSTQRTGFSASYSKSTSFCGGNLTASHGAFSTPNYPSLYPLNAECIWHLNAAPGNQIQLTFVAFNLEQSVGCANDYVEVRDGSNLHNSLGRFCGSSIPRNLTIAKSMYVKFRSNNASSYTGFTASFSTLTGGDLVGNTGQLASPMYPRNYPHNSRYTWTIMVDIGKKVRIQFSDFDIEVGAACTYDYLKFLDGPAGSTELMKVCGTTAPQPFTSTGNVMTVIFITDISATGRGFLLGWTAVDQVIRPPGTTIIPPTNPAGCNFVLVATNDDQNITSPGWPSNYANGLDCTWTIRSANGARIQFIMQEMEIESSLGCVYDSLKIYNGIAGQRILGTKCGRSGLQDALVTSGGLMTLKFKSDSSINLKGFRGIFKTTCGGTLTATTGVILSPNHPNTYDVNSTCEWRMTVANGRTIELKVDSFNLPSSSNCTGDRLRILNGNNANSPHLDPDKWAFCGGQTPATNAIMTSSSRFLFVQFTADAQSDSGTNNFKLTYKEKSVTCGGDLTIPDDENFVGSFTSPGFTDGSYPHNADCTWIITAPSNARIQLDFPHFDIEKHSLCTYDYVMVRDGGTENSAQLARICGSDTQATVRSTSNVMRVRLITDDSVVKGGFNITYKKESCGGTLIGARGVIKSPQFPSDYPNNADCEWYLQAPIGHYMTMNFTRFALGTSVMTNCTGQDALTVYNRDRLGNVTSQVGSYCGNRAPVEVRTIDSKAYLRFTSNAATNFAGFSLNFYASVDTCGGQLTTPSGVIQSPNYPFYYPHGRECRWFITAPEGQRVTVAFEVFAIESQTACLFDYVEMFNGHLPRSPKLGRFCGNNTGHTVSSTGNKLLVHFNSDGSISNGGFRLTYTTAQPAVCGGVISPSIGAIGHIITPGYEESILVNGNVNLTGQYPNNMQCEWNIRGAVTENSSVVIKFQPNRFKLEHDGECRFDFLLLREGASSAGREAGRFCSNLTNNVPTQIAMPGNQVWVAFVSDDSIQHQGFNITYQFAPCGGVYRGDAGVITSPNYPQAYSHDMGCAWEIIADAGMQIELTIDAFNIESSTKCDYDYVALYNGGSHMSPLMHKFCQAAAGKVYTSASNVMRVEFVSDFSRSESGFSMSYRTKSQGCGGVFNSLTGNISTQNYPGHYPHNTECIWDIIVPDGYHVNLRPDGIFDIEAGAASSSTCVFDYVQFFDVDANGVATERGRRYCGHTAPEPQKSNGNHMRVKFRSDRGTNGVGFNFRWIAGCGGTYTADSGVIFSPGYPNNYKHNLTCDYTIVAAIDQYLVLKFDDSNFRIEHGSTCQYDSVSVYEGGVNGTSKGKFCGLTAPQPIATRGTMLVRFVTDGDTADDGFKATYIKSDCGGYLNGTYGTLKSPTHPVDYHNNLNCTWQIEVASNMSVNLRFEEFELEAGSNGNCQYDYLAVYDGMTPSLNTLIGRFCGSPLPESVRSRSNSMTVVFKTDASVTKGGFRAVYTQTYGELQGCGGRLNVTSGTIVPLRASNGRYLSGLNCIWVLTAPDDKVFSFEVKDIAIEAGQGGACSFDGLELIDGFSSQDRKFGPTICGTVPNKNYVSATNMMRVRFFSDASVSVTGFTLNYTAISPRCGGVVRIQSGDSPVNISSPEYPSQPSNPPTNCRWVIGAPAGKRIRITVTDLAITGDTRCSNNFLQLRDQPITTNAGPGQNLQMCNVTTPYVFDSFGNEAQINFKHATPATSGYRGFVLTYGIADCNRTFTQLDGRITSPGFPSTYDHSQNCVITIAVPNPGYKIALYFRQFAIEAHTQCNYDYLEIFDGTATSANSKGKRCGLSIPDPIISTGNTMTLQFVTDGSVSLTGFDLTYVASPSGCGGKLTATHGTFSSPPRTAGQSTVCVWILELPTRRRPTLTFDVMDLRQNDTSCPNAHVEVRNGGDSTAPLMGRFCDGSVPALTAANNKLYVRFVSDSSLNSDAKFTAKYSSGDRDGTRRAISLTPAARRPSS